MNLLIILRILEGSSLHHLFKKLPKLETDGNICSENAEFSSEKFIIEPNDMSQKGKQKSDINWWHSKNYQQ